MKKFLYKFKNLKLYFIITGFISLIWLVIRTGKKPSRINYPCQKVVLNNSILFLSYILGFLGIKVSKELIKKNIRLFYIVLISTTLIIALGAAGFIYKTFYPPISNADNHTHLPMGTGTSRVVWVHRTNASNWEDLGKPNDYWNYVDQTTVNQMMDDGIKALTGANTVLASWQNILPDYDATKIIAIKVNFNNGGQYDFNSIPQTIHSLIRELKVLGFSEDRIYVYDTMKQIYSTTNPSSRNNFYNYLKADYPSIHIRDCCGGNGREAKQTGSTFVMYTRTLTFDKILDDADYIINVPIFKMHGFSHVITFSFKNHFGSVHQIIFGGSECESPLHAGISTTNYTGCFSYFGESLVQLNNQPQIKNKTRLIIGDAIFAHSTSNTGVPQRNLDALFFSKDTVAADSIMFDFLHKIWVDENDWHRNGDTQDQLYLEHAATDASLGVHAHAVSWTDGVPAYTLNNGNGIDFVSCNPSCPGTPQTYTLTVLKSGNGSGTVTSSPSSINCGSTCSNSFNSGTSVVLTASPASSSNFSGWSGGGCLGTGTCSINLNSNASTTASFALKTYTITASSSSGGSISPSGSLLVNYGSNQTFTITANYGYHISNVSVDSVSQGVIPSYTFNNITANHTISASFEANTDYQTVCETNGGHWLITYSECEGISEDICTTYDGFYNSCGSPCRHNSLNGERKSASSTGCVQHCVSFCTFGGQGQVLTAESEQSQFSPFNVISDLKEETTKSIDKSEGNIDTLPISQYIGFESRIPSDYIFSPKPILIYDQYDPKFLLYISIVLLSISTIYFTKYYVKVRKE